MSTLFIDADACPVTRDAIPLARAAGWPVVMVANSSQDLSRYAARPGVTTVEVGRGRDAADFAIIERLQPGDIVVTQDTGLAAMVLGRGARAIGVRGRIYNLATIDAEMFIRHEEQKLRRSGGRTRGPAPYLEEDREYFIEGLERMLREKM